MGNVFREGIFAFPLIPPSQSHYIEVAQGAIFMEQNMRFGLILGRLAMLKKNLGPIMTNF